MPAMTTDVIGVLRQTDLLRSLTPADLEAVAEASRLRTFRRGQVVFTTGDPGDTLIMVISGRVKVVVRSADGGELTLTIVRMNRQMRSAGSPAIRCRRTGKSGVSRVTAPARRRG